jgi:heme exporter protein D
MTYLPYIIGAYAVFGVVLAWDGLSPWLKYGRLLRAIRQRATRDAIRGRIASTRVDE